MVITLDFQSKDEGSIPSSRSTKEEIESPEFATKYPI